MPARRLVVAAASGVALLSLTVSAPANAAKNNDNQRTTTTEHKQRKSSDTTRRSSTTDAPSSSTTPATSDRATTTSSTSESTGTTSAKAPAVSTTTSTTSKPVPMKRYIVVLKKGNSPSGVASEHARLRHVKVERIYGHALNGYSGNIPDDQVDAIKKDNRVAYVELNRSFKKLAQILPWGVEKVSRVGNNWSSTVPGDGQGSVDMDVYVIDTGIQNNPDLNGATEFSSQSGPTTDCDGHGTNMAGIAGAIDNTTGVVGVAPGVRVHGVKVLDCRGRGSTVDAIAGVDWVVAQGAPHSVITMSFGGPISQSFDDSVRRALSAGFFITTAAGNSHKDACKTSPADLGVLDGVMTVGATTKSDRPASFSNFGKCVDIWAPGVKITSLFLNGALAIGTGTSASAPHVAGVAALYLSANRGAAPSTVEAAIKSNAVHIGSLLRASSANF